MGRNEQNHDIRMPPQDLAAEKSLLGCQILDCDCIASVGDLITVGDYFSDVHQKIQAAIFLLHSEGIAVDPVTLADKLLQQRELVNVGGAQTLMELMDTVPYSSHYAHYAASVKDKAVRRRTIEAGKKIVEDAYDLSCSGIRLVDEADSKLTAIAAELTKAERRPKSLKQHMIELVDKIGKGEKLTQFLGIDEVDEAIGGVAWGENVVVGGLTRHGKTMFTMQWLRMAARRGVPSMMFAKEMNGASLCSRSLKSLTDIPQDQWHLQNPLLMADVERNLEGHADIMIEENCDSIRDIERAVENGVREYGIRIIALDYIQLMMGDGMTREQQVTDISRRWKRMLMRHDLIGILLSQFNREATKIKKVPTINDFRDSGSIANDADIALIPYWEAKEDNSVNPRLYRIYIGKLRQREMKTNVVEMRVNGAEQWLYPSDGSSFSEVPDNF